MPASEQPTLPPVLFLSFFRFCFTDFRDQAVKFFWNRLLKERLERFLKRGTQRLRRAIGVQFGTGAAQLIVLRLILHEIASWIGHQTLHPLAIRSPEYQALTGPQ